LEQAGAARLIPEAQLSTERVGVVVAELLSSPATLTEMSEKARKLSHPNAGSEIAQIATELAERSHRT
jgi:UDP-N-acetylglucosamine--N-acetylmuramyl-(pentapeptide) pyrophosphoryl-undecaprenol N-acetylglucosamine transferase